MLLCLLNTVMNYISRICNEGERHPFNPCSPYQQSSFRTRIIKIFTDIIALRYVILLEKSNLQISLSGYRPFRCYGTAD